MQRSARLPRHRRINPLLHSGYDRMIVTCAEKSEQSICLSDILSQHESRSLFVSRPRPRMTSSAARAKKILNCEGGLSRRKMHPKFSLAPPILAERAPIERRASSERKSSNEFLIMFFNGNRSPPPFSFPRAASCTRITDTCTHRSEFLEK